MKIAKTAEPVIDTTIVKAPRTVIPAKAGIQGRSLANEGKSKDPGFPIKNVGNDRRKQRKLSTNATNVLPR